MSLEDNNVLAFSVSITCNIKGSTILDVDNCNLVIFDELEPSGVGCPDLEVI
jgi:hypothetical protein